MGWKPAQQRLHRAACRAANIDDDHRKLILRQLGGRALVDGQPSSTSPRLTQRDFNRFMSTVEGYAGGTLGIIDQETGKPCGENHWLKREGDNPRKMLVHELIAIVNTLHIAGVPERLEGVIGQATGQEIEQLEAVRAFSADYARLAIHALRAIAKRHDIPLKPGNAA